jgi:hypothetical protein
VPRPGQGVRVERPAGRPVAVADLGTLKVEVRLTTSSEFVVVHFHVRNDGKEPEAIEPSQVTFVCAGEEIDSLDPDLYVSMAFNAKPYEVDASGKVVDKDARRLPVRVFTPGNASGSSLAEQMTADQWEEEASNERVRATRELLALRRDPLVNGGRIPPGRSVRGRRILQRTNVKLPLVVRFEHRRGRMSVRFDRERR